MPTGAVYVGRPGRWGNPFPTSTPTPAGRAEAVAQYRAWITGQPALIAAARRDLAGRDLACWCPLDQPCHADELLRIAATPEEPPMHTDMHTDLMYRTVNRFAARLDLLNGTSREEISLRILKVTEEAGEAAAAWIGTIGQNPRKGVTHSRADVATELADVVLAALVAIASIGHDPATVVNACVTKVNARLNQLGTAGTGITEAEE